MASWSVTYETLDTSWEVGRRVARGVAKVDGYGQDNAVSWLMARPLGQNPGLKSRWKLRWYQGMSHDRYSYAGVPKPF